MLYTETGVGTACEGDEKDRRQSVDVAIAIAGVPLPPSCISWGGRFALWRVFVRLTYIM